MENPYKKYFKNLPFKMSEIISPIFPDFSLNIKDFGAIGDGKTLCTSSFINAINTLSEKGGGRLIIPRGDWYTGPIQLKSNINLHLEEGAIVQFSGDENLYPLIKTSYEGMDSYRCQSPISALNATNIAITGNGIIDGNGHFWRPVKKKHLTDRQWKEIKKRKYGLIFSNNFWVPNEPFFIADNKENNNSFINEITDLKELNKYKRYLRPVMISLRNCKNIFFKGVMFQNSPAWNIHLLMSENIIIDNIYVKNPVYAINGDGIDLDSCKIALIINTTIDVGDDGICLKSGNNKLGKTINEPSENIIIYGCNIFSGHSGFSIGSEMSGGVRNVKISNTKFLGTDNGLRFKSRIGMGGIVENIYVENISMKNIIKRAIIFNMNYTSKNPNEINNENYRKTRNITNIKSNEAIPIYRNIYIKNIICDGANQAMLFIGLPEMPIHNIFFKNIIIFANKGAEFNNTRNIVQENVNITINKNN